MHYIIDAYNLLFRLAKTSTALKNKRRELIETLNELVNALKLNVTLVFDGDDPFSKHHAREHFDSLEIIYTPRAISADSFILEKIDSVKRPENYVVVTNDRTLAASCKMLKANHLTIDAFMQLLLKKKKREKRAIVLKDSDREISRLLKIFEKRILEPIEED